MKSNFIVVGDTILDRFIYGDAVRISPEAPTLVLDVRNETNIVGGAFNVYAHIFSLGGAVKLISVTGIDIEKYMDEFPDLSIHQERLCLIKDSSRVTPVKTRLVSLYKLSHLLRFDKEKIQQITTELEDQILEHVATILNENASLLIVDYKKGVITDRLSQELIKMARLRHVKVYVDSKRDDIELFTGAYLFKPNKVEFHNIRLRYQFPLDDDIAACRALMDRFDISNVVLTLGSRGMVAVSQDGQVITVPGNEVTLKELSGAGDSVLAVLSTLVSENVSLRAALEASNNVAARYISTSVSYRAKREDLFNK